MDDHSWEKWFWGPVDQVTLGVKLPGPENTATPPENVVYATEYLGGDIYVNTGVWQWNKIGGPGRQFVTHGNILYGLSPDRSGVYRYTGMPGQWTHVGGPALRLYGGLAGLFAVAPDSGDIVGLDCTCGGVFRSGWLRIGGPANSFAVASRYLYSLSINSEVFRFDFNMMQWSQIGDRASLERANIVMQIYAGGNKLYASTSDGPHEGDLYEYDDQASTWKKIFFNWGGTFAVEQLDGHIYSVGRGCVLKYEKPFDWRPMGSPAESIYAGCGYVYAKRADNTLWRYGP